MQKNIDADTACRLLYELQIVRSTECVPLGNAHLRVCAAEVTARIPVPPFNRSPFDGYALRGEDTQSATRANPVTLKITEEIPAGKEPTLPVTPGTAAKILTGAPIPKGANTTVKYEETEFTAEAVRILAPVAADTNIIPAGSDVSQGTLLASAGTLITPAVLSAFANQGMSEIEVFKKPVITVINTGSELCEAGAPLPPASIYNSSVHTLSGYLSETGAIAVNGGTVRDDPEEIAQKIAAALKSSDMVITTGGASAGDYDCAVTSAQSLGAQLLFRKINMKPGGAMMAASLDGKVILALSGNPAAAVLGLFRIAMPYIKKLCGRADCFLPEIQVMLKHPFNKHSPKTRVLRGRLEIIDTRAYFTEIGSQGSEALSSLVGCNLFGEIPAGSGPLPAGAVIKAYQV